MKTDSRQFTELLELIGGAILPHRPRTVMTYSKCDFIGHDSCRKKTLLCPSVFRQLPSMESEIDCRLQSFSLGHRIPSRLVRIRAAGKSDTSQNCRVRVPSMIKFVVSGIAPIQLLLGSQVYRKPYASAQCVQAAGDASTLTMIK